MESRWTPKQEIKIEYDPAEKEAYGRRLGSFYTRGVRWPPAMWNGRGTKGEFAMIVTAKYYREKGYEVWVSGSRIPAKGVPSAASEGWVGFFLLHYPGKREARDPKYVRLADFFGGLRKLDALNKRTDALKIKLKGNRFGGDPDLFVFRGSERFFVEAKDVGDKLRPVQLLCFSEIERLLGTKVVIATLVPAPRS